MRRDRRIGLARPTVPPVSDCPLASFTTEEPRFGRGVRFDPTAAARLANDLGADSWRRPRHECPDTSIPTHHLSWKFWTHRAAGWVEAPGRRHPPGSDDRPRLRPALGADAPHASIHSVKDFLFHLLAITVGLLIALGLEVLVNTIHHAPRLRKPVRRSAPRQGRTLASYRNTWSG